MKTIISKTDYILFRECPHNTWYKIYKPELFYACKLSEFELAIIETGNDVEMIARNLFPDGVLIEGRDQAAQTATIEHLSNHTTVLFQPVFVVDGYLAVLDVLKFNPENGSYSIYEVKSTNSVDSSCHFHDLAYQVNLLEKLGLSVEGLFLIHLNGEYVREGELDINALFKIADVSQEVNAVKGSVIEEMKQALEFLSKSDIPNGNCPCIYKGRSRHCSTFKHSNPDVPEYSIHDISRIGSSKAKLKELVDGKYFALDNIPAHIKLTDIQKNQVEAHISGIEKVDLAKIREELGKMSFPIHFIDYETFPCAIPRFNGFSPYQQIPFQCSLHIIDSKESQPRHFEYLCTSADDPSVGFAKFMESNVNGEGTIVVWNKQFESKINSELGKRISEVEGLINSMNSRIYDLMDVFSKQYYVNRYFQGKTSIKNILPVLVPELSYKALDIQEGGTASQKWNEMTTGNLDDPGKEKIALDLKKYCELDTLAMYKIWEYLHSIS